MEIHKPKPVHSWREFLTELGTIVLGIIIAICLEQGVEWLHWQSEVKEARKALLAEIVSNNANFFAFRVSITPCMDRKMGEADAILTALETGRKPDPSFNPPLGTGAFMRDSEWQSDRASQILTHFPRNELALMSRYYGQLDDFGGWIERENSAWTMLAVLRNPPAGTTAPELIGLRAALANAQSAENLISVNAKRELQVSAQLGLSDPKPDTERADNFCNMTPEDYRRYRASQDLR